MIDDMAGECSTSSGLANPNNHTPGPWRWEVNLKGRLASLCGGRNPYDLIVVDFVRWGMGGAMPRFRTGSDDLNIMKPVHEFVAPVAGREHHSSWFQGVDHPDARLIAASPQLLAALELADQILARDGLQELRGLAWHDGERFVIQEAIRVAKGTTVVEELRVAGRVK